MSENIVIDRCCSMSGVRCAGDSPLLRARSAPSLTAREREVLAMLADGYGYEQIAMRLEIALGTVRTYVVRLYRKLGVNTKSEAAAIAVRVGILW